MPLGLLTPENCSLITVLIGFSQEFHGKSKSLCTKISTDLYLKPEVF